MDTRVGIAASVIISVTIVVAALAFWPDPAELSERDQISDEPSPTQPVRRRVLVPRPAIADDDTDPRGTEFLESEAHRVGMAGVAEPTPPTSAENRRRDTGQPALFEAGSEELRGAIQDAVAGVVSDVTQCISEWATSPEGSQLDGRVLMSFTLDEHGMDEIYVMDVEQVPEAPLTCFSETLYDADWPAVDGQMSVNYPFIVSAE